MTTKHIIKEGNYIPLDNKRLVSCARCGTLYEYEKGKPDNTYEDYDNFSHYDCPICGLEYYPVFWWFILYTSFITDLNYGNNEN